MRNALVFGWLSLAVLIATAGAQQTTIVPQVRTKPTADNKITAIELAAHFVTAIRLPEAVNSVVVGDPALFQVEHSEHEPELVFVKALTNEHAESNLLISTARGRQISFLLVSGGEGPNSAKVDFLLRYQPSGGFLVEPDAVPFALVAQTASVSKAQAAALSSVASPSATGAALLPASLTTASSPVEKVPTQPKPDSLDSLLDRQKQAPMPVLYGERPEGDEVKGDRLRAGISEVLDGGQQVIVLFSVVNTSKHAILLMPPQIQLGGQDKSGKLIKHEHWSTAEQLAVIDFRLSRRRIGPGERAEGLGVSVQRHPRRRVRQQLLHNFHVLSVALESIENVWRKGCQPILLLMPSRWPMAGYGHALRCSARPVACRASNRRDRRGSPTGNRKIAYKAFARTGPSGREQLIVQRHQLS
jgi:hypothetical protein